jgi:predicted lipid-binding transport protein (Tim44 family)
VIPAATGGRGSRADWAGVHRAPVRSNPAPTHALPPAGTVVRPSLGTLAGCAAGALTAGLLAAGFGLDHGLSLGVIDLSLGGSIVVLLIVFHRLRATHARPPRTPLTVSTETTADESAGGGSSLDRGVADIRRTDPGFDPTRLAGYTSMVFRDAQAAWATQDLAALRDRVTPEMYVGLHVQRARLRKIGHADGVDRIEITAEITEAWQEDGRDYATACIEGSIVDYTVDGATSTVIHGSQTVPRDIEEFWTFTRPAGLNFWMLSAIRTT